MDEDPDPTTVRRLVFVPFLPGGSGTAASDGGPTGATADPDDGVRAAASGRGGARVAVPDGPVGPHLPAGDVEPGEHWLLDASRRIPMLTAGFRAQRIHPFAADGDTVYAWLDGDRYTGTRPHRRVRLVVDDPAGIARRLAAAGRTEQATALRDGHRSFLDQDESSYYADNLRLLEPAYLRGSTPQAGSGFGGDAALWRTRRGIIMNGIDRHGTFLDVGCANGLLAESIQSWAAERGLRVEPYGVDLAPRLVALARRRLPHWADRFDVGNAIDWRPDDGQRFTFVHVLLDLVPAARTGDLLRHALDTLVERGGRLLVSVYQGPGGSLPGAAEQVSRLGFPVAGASTTDDGAASTAWLDS
ncbi:hypothetical protein CIK06_08005 [Plantactinospora sp. KBS50]|nr:hypothetical protein CIK06_08005 [Plantactinospora sp. KBS50]